MSRQRIAFLLLVIAYFATGFFIVKGNEKAAVKRFGRARTTFSGSPLLLGSGLHYELPWPFTEVKLVNINEVKSFSIGSPEMDGLATNAFLQEVQPDNQSQFLTGDKNILNLQINVQYRISERGIYQYYFGTTRPDQRLRLLVESAASDLISRSGVDFVHPLGLAELRAELTQSTREFVDQYRLGVEVEDVTIVSVYPPVRVKAQFLDVSNARADKETYINTALGYAQQRASEARAEKQQIRDESETYRQQTIEVARSEAYRFNKMVERLHLDEQAGIQSYSEARQMALHRHYMDVMNLVMRKVAGKVFLDSGEPVDLTIFRDPQE